MIDRRLIHEAGKARLESGPDGRKYTIREGLYEFVKLGWSIAVPHAPFVDGWHIRTVCSHLEAVTHWEITRLLINIPPGCMKTLLLQVFWPAWEWTLDPSQRHMFASYTPKLTLDASDNCRRLVSSEWYRKTWGDLADTKALSALGKKPVILAEDKADTRSEWYTVDGGMRFATSMGGTATGFHAHKQGFDDPTNLEEFLSSNADAAREMLQKTVERYKGKFSTRQADPKHFARIVCMQRLHDLDLAGFVSKEEDYVKVILPMEYDPELRCDTAWGYDPRTKEGELLWPEFKTRKTVDATKEDLGPRNAVAQLGQRPSAADGSIFKRPWFNHRWKVLPAGAKYIQSWDCAFKDASTSDWVVGQVWAKLGARYFLIDQVRARMDLPTTLQAVRDMTVRWPEARIKLFEDKANGPAVVQTLINEVIGLMLVTPLGGKEARANACSPYWEAGNVFLPEAQPWVHDFVEEHVVFPVGAHDDQVDSADQAILYFEEEKPHAGGWRSAMQKVIAARKKGG